MANISSDFVKKPIVVFVAVAVVELSWLSLNYIMLIIMINILLGLFGDSDYEVIRNIHYCASLFLSRLGSGPY